MDLKEFFNTLAGCSYEDMQRKVRMKEAEKAAAKVKDKGNELKRLHFGDYGVFDYDDFVSENEGIADAINSRGDKSIKDVLLDFFKGQPGQLSSYEKDGNIVLTDDNFAPDDELEILPENFSALEEAAKRYAANNIEPDDEKPKSYAGMSDEELDKSETKLLNGVFDNKKPEGRTVEKTTLKVEGDMPEDKKEEVAEKLLKKSAKDEVMPSEEFDKLISRKPNEEEELDNDVEAVMDLVYKLPPEKAAKVLGRLNGLNLPKGNVPSDKNVKEGC